MPALPVPAKVRNEPAQARRVSIIAAQGSATQPPPDLSSSIPLDCSGRKRALLIGIRSCKGYAELQGAHEDVAKMRLLLLDVYGYTEDDITVILDDKIAGHVQPTRVNILSAIADFVKGVKAGDQLLFHYCGHSTQVVNRTGSEDDGMDECLVPQDGEENKIIDNDLHRALVAPLPANAHLVAVLDTCHSGSLLDLKHYRCNRVVVPWKWRGKRNSEEIRSQVVRRDARFLSLGEVATTFLPRVDTTQAPSDQAGTARSQIRRRSILSTNCDSQAPSSAPSPVVSSAMSRVATPVASRAPSPAPSRKPLVRLRTQTRTRAASIFAPGKENAPASATSSLPPVLAWILPEDDAHRCDSPTARWVCTGWCRAAEEGAGPDEEDPVKADVISLASCKDSQETYEVDGKSMTSSLVDLLRENPNRTIKDVLVSMSHAMYDMALKRHADQQAYKRKRKAFIDKLGRFLAFLERRPNRAKTDPIGFATKPALAPVLAPAPIGPMPQMRAGAGRPRAASMPVADLISRVKSKLQHTKEARGLGMDSFQNPELASPRPLDMNRQWRM